MEVDEEEVVVVVEAVEEVAEEVEDGKPKSNMFISL